jgi:uncharacterized DUF497 family protein
MDLVFEWDARKAKGNLRKHGITFDEATTLFDDALASIFPDEDHSGAEEREILVGYSILNRLLLVCFTERKGRVRIISARKATASERNDHEKHLQG